MAGLMRNQLPVLVLQKSRPKTCRLAFFTAVSIKLTIFAIYLKKHVRLTIHSVDIYNKLSDII